MIKIDFATSHTHLYGGGVYLLCVGTTLFAREANGRVADLERPYRVIAIYEHHPPCPDVASIALGSVVAYDWGY